MAKKIQTISRAIPLDLVSYSRFPTVTAVVQEMLTALGGSADMLILRMEKLVDDETEQPRLNDGS